MKRTITILLGVIMALALVSCGSTDTAKSSTEKSKDAASSSTASSVVTPDQEKEASTSTPATTPESTDGASSSNAETKEGTPEPTVAPYEVELSPGSYRAGIHFPEGIYNVEVVSGLGNLLTTTGVTASLGSGTAANYGKTYSNLTMPNGAVMQLTQSLTVKITTDKAVFSSMEPFTNPATKEVQLSAGTYTAGKDIPAGSYDLSVVEGTAVNVNTGDYSFSAMFSTDTALAESSGSSYKNLLLPNGQTLQIASGSIKLTPSPNTTPLTP